MDYEVKIVALANIIENPSKFGITLDDSPNEPYFAIVHPEMSTSIANIAETSRANEGAFTKLNGQYKSTDYPLSQKNRVLLPLQNQTIYYASLGKTLPSGISSTNVELAANSTSKFWYSILSI
jgi:membrane-bound lytic murein transglycosylase D